MNNTTLNNVALRIDVETVHGDRAEYVIDSAMDRTNVEYYHELEKMLNTALDLTSYGYVEEVDCYYKVNFDVRVYHLEDVATVLQICDNTVAHWKSRYNIDRMIPYDPT